MNRLDYLLIIVGNCVPHSMQAHGKGRITDRAPLPHIVDNLVFGDQATAILQKKLEKRQGLGRSVNHHTVVQQLECICVEDAVSKSVSHVRPDILVLFYRGSTIITDMQQKHDDCSDFWKS